MTLRISTLVGLLTGTVLALLVGLAVMFGLRLTDPAQAQTNGSALLPQITVVGRGEVTGTPDTARIQIGVETQAETTQDALAQNNTQTTAVIEKLKELGVADRDIQTSNFNIYPRYDDNGRQITGYNVSNTVNVTIRNLDQAGELLDEVVQVGANRVYGISFSVDDPSALMAQAREAAVANALEHAQQLAGGANATVGRVLVITENVGQPPVVPVGRGDMLEAAPAAAPIERGEQTFMVMVQVTYELQ